MYELIPCGLSTWFLPISSWHQMKIPPCNIHRRQCFMWKNDLYMDFYVWERRFELDTFKFLQLSQNYHQITITFVCYHTLIYTQIQTEKQAKSSEKSHITLFIHHCRISHNICYVTSFFQYHNSNMWTYGMDSQDFTWELFKIVVRDHIHL